MPHPLSCSVAMYVCVPLLPDNFKRVIQFARSYLYFAIAIFSFSRSPKRLLFHHFHPHKSGSGIV